MNIYYRIQEREFSSNIIEKGVEKESGKISWTPHIAPLSDKEMGDKMCNLLMKTFVELNKKKDE